MGAERDWIEEDERASKVNISITVAEKAGNKEQEASWSHFITDRRQRASKLSNLKP